MAKYKVKHDYKATFMRGGANEYILIPAGKVVELDDDLAAFIKRDAPKELVRAQGTSAKAKKKAAKK